MSGLRVAAYGCGGMQRGLLGGLKGCGGGELVAAIDSDLNAAQRMAEELGGQPFTSFQAALEVADFDSVFVATPGFLHADNVVEAFAAGKHVFCEKPMAFTVADCDRMIAAGEAAGKKLMVGHVLRYLPVFQKMLDLVESGEYGTPYAAEITRTWEGWGGSHRSWRDLKTQAGGILYEVSIHELDFMRCLMGNATRVSAEQRRTGVVPADYNDVVQVAVGFERGQGVMTALLSAALGYYDGRIWLTEGFFWFDMSQGTLVLKKRGGEQQKLSTADFSADYEPGVQREIREFVEAVLEDKPCAIPGSEGRANIEVCEAADLSAERGAVIKLPL